MADSIACVNSRLLLKELALQKSDYFSLYETYGRSGMEQDRARLLEAKKTLDEKFSAVEVMLRPVTLERMYDLRKQYLSQVRILKKLGFATDPNSTGDPTHPERERIVLQDINGNTCVAPSFLEIWRQITNATDSFLGMKADQGFKKLLLVPFGASLASLVEKLRTYLSNASSSPLAFDQKTGLVLDNDIANADQEDEVAYNVRLFQPGDHCGWTKRGYLNAQDNRSAWDLGWRVCFAQTGADGEGIRSIPWTGEGKADGEHHSREEIDARSNSWESLENFLAEADKPRRAAFR